MIWLLRSALKVKLFPRWLHCVFTLIKLMIDMNGKYKLMWWHFKQELSSCWDGRPVGHNKHRAYIGPKAKKWGGAAVGTGPHHLTQYGLPLYQVASWSIQPFGHNCSNATLLRVWIPLRTIFIRSLVVTRQNIYSMRALSCCSIPNKIK